MSMSEIVDTIAIDLDAGPSKVVRNERHDEHGDSGCRYRDLAQHGSRRSEVEITTQSITLSSIQNVY